MAFEQVTAPDGVVWRRSSLLEQAGMPHGFSTRLGGVSPAPFDSLNLGLADAPGDPDEWARVQRNWERFMKAVGLQGRRLARARQVHGIAMLQPDLDPACLRAEPPFQDGDALVTTDRRHAIAVRVADCAPVLLADPVAGVVGAVHAGWRGTVAGVVDCAIDAMCARGAQPSRMVAAIGACIGAHAFEVGPEVHAAFERAGLGSAVRACEASGKWHADLRQALQQQLEQRGVPATSVDADPACTVGDTKHLFSYRGEGPRSGRMAAVIGL